MARNGLRGRVIRRSALWVFVGHAKHAGFLIPELSSIPQNIMLIFLQITDLSLTICVCVCVCVLDLSHLQSLCMCIHIYIPLPQSYNALQLSR